MAVPRAAAWRLCCAAVFVALLGAADARSSLPHGGVEDKEGNRIEGATTPGAGVTGLHHLELMFQTVLCAPHPFRSFGSSRRLLSSDADCSGAAGAGRHQNTPMMLAAIVTAVVVCCMGCFMWDIGDAAQKKLKKKQTTKTRGGTKDAAL